MPAPQRPLAGAGPRRKVERHAFDSTFRSSNRGGCPPLVGESLPSNAGINQVNPKRRGSYRCTFLAPERFRVVSLPLPRTCRKRLVETRTPGTS